MKQRASAEIRFVIASAGSDAKKLEPAVIFLGIGWNIAPASIIGMPDETVLDRAIDTVGSRWGTDGAR